MTIKSGEDRESANVGKPAVHSLDSFTLFVPDLGAADRFYSAFGLDVRAEDGALSLFTTGNGRRCGIVREGARKSLSHLSFCVLAGDFSRFEKWLEDQNVPIIPPLVCGDGPALWFRDPDGNAIQLKIGGEQAPSRSPTATRPRSAGGERAAPLRAEVKKVFPRRLSHVLLFASDVSKSVDFYSRVLGLRLSDEAAGIIAFMHGGHGSDHHMVAFAKSDGPGFHHCSFDVGSVDDVGEGAAQMAAAGYSAGWGLGRHVLGSNYFHYVQDPWGSFCEYSYDIDFIPPDTVWQAGSHKAEDSLYLWGPPPPSDFVTNYELAN